MKKKVIIFILLSILIINIISIYYPRNLGEIIGSEDIIKNIDELRIEQEYWNGRFETKSIIIKDKNKIKEIIEFISNQKVRRIINFWGSGYISDAEIYMFNFNSEGSIDTIGSKYVFCSTNKVKERIRKNFFLKSNKSSLAYKFTKDFDIEYLRDLFKNYK